MVKTEIPPFGNLEITREADVVHVKLNRPKKRNSFDELMVREITSTFESFTNTGGCPKVAVLSSTGETFCAGADLNWMRKMADFSFEQNVADARDLSRMFEAIFNSPVAVISRVHGAALGGGVGLAAAADFCVADESSRFAFTEVLLNLRPSTISLYCVARMGGARAKDLFCSGRQITAQEAKTFGLIDECVEDKRLDASVDSVVSHAIKLGKQGLRELARSKKKEVVVEGDLPEEPREIIELVDKVANALNDPTPTKRSEVREFLARDIASARISPGAQTKMREFLSRIAGR